MNLQEAIDVLKRHNDNKRGHPVEIPDIRVLVEAIDTVIEWAEKPKFTLSQVIEMFVVAKSMTEHLDEKGRNEYFDRIINFIGKEETK